MLPGSTIFVLFRMNSERWQLMTTVRQVGAWARIIVLQLVTLATSSCAHHGAPLSDSALPENTEPVDVVLREWYVLPHKRTVDAGVITFKVANQGRMEHEFIVIMVSQAITDLPVNEQGLNERTAGKLIGEIEEIDPGETREVTYSLRPGNYVLLCNRVGSDGKEIVSHYRRGMHVAFTVK
jgi:uncharacterized cupredoxin-like copper-binding protein